MKHSTFARSRIGALLFAGAMGFAAQAHAIDFNVTPTFSPQVAAVPSGMGLVYKADYAESGPVEEGNAWSYYTTVFTGEVGEPSGATITWDVDAMYYIACPSCYLVVQDGNHIPPQYIFDISTWNGQDTLVLSGFWLDKGAISNIAIWNDASNGGGTVAAIPEAETYAMMLAGLGLVGFAVRRKRGKTA